MNFKRDTFNRLEAIQKFSKGEGPLPRFVAEQGIRTVEELSRFLALDKGDSHPRRKKPFDLFAANLNNVLKYMRKYDKDPFAWFK